jgi:beta-phosphoglucomutase
MDSVIFDFDGVIVDSEPVHFAGFAAVLRERGIELSWDDYRERYLGYDDHDCFLAVCADRGAPLGETEVAALSAAKTAVVREVLAASVEALPGAAALIGALGDAGVPLAICSGALRPEIEIAARRVGVLDRFAAVVAAEDVPAGKPDPSGYALALESLRAATSHPLGALRSLAIEDSPAGIEAARRAGLRVLAVTTSYPASALTAADAIVASLADVTVEQLAALAEG